jgi:DNA ligase (NAD+)
MQLAFFESLETMSTDDLVNTLQAANLAYRKGAPIMDDPTYDQVYLAELKKREPQHPYLAAVEPEPDLPTGKIRHKQPMKSTDKAYTSDEIEAFVRRVERAALKIGMDTNTIFYEINAKLDGMAAHIDGKELASRGNGLVGHDISDALTRGVAIKGHTPNGAGEIVVDKEYYNKNLAQHFTHPRNFVAGLVGSDTLSTHAQQALKDGAIHLVLFYSLPSVLCRGDQLVADVDTLCKEVFSACDYHTDGAVISVSNKDLRAELGSTSHHHCWQIAKKTKGDTAIATVEGVTWQVGRSGRITPVINIEPTDLSGATIRNVTAHHAGYIHANNIGLGAKLEIVRSGEVIPSILNIIEEGHPHQIPGQCPSCNSALSMQGDFLVCTYDACKGQRMAQLLHFFNIIGNVNLFGPKTIETLYAEGYTDLLRLYSLTHDEFLVAGYSTLQADNLIAELRRSLSEPLENWRLLAAIGIHKLGRGDSRKLLRHHAIDSLDTLKPAQLKAIPGFGEITSESIPRDLKAAWPLIKGLLDLGFNLTSDVVPSADSPIAGKHLVFTGAMEQSRDDMKEQARQLGGVVQSSVNKKTNFLVIGERVGAKKIQAAEANGTTVITEADYTQLIKE